MTFQQVGAVAAAAVNRWSWYFAALKDPSEIGKSLIATTTPEQGYFRTRQKGGQWEPIAIYYPEGSDELVAYRSGKEVRPEDIWTWCLRHPITFEQYQKAMAGDGFDDEPPAPIGDNSGSTDPLEAIKIELAGEAEQVAEFLKRPVNSQADADKLGIWARRLTDIAKRADNQRVVEKEPHLAASRAVDDRWRDPIADAKDWATKAKRHVEPFLIAQKRAQEEAARKAREEAERQRQAAQATEDEEQRTAALQAAQEAEKAAETRNASAGRTGARVSIRVEKVGVVTDYAKAAAALVAMKHPDMIAEIDRLAKAAAKKNFPFDGMEIREEEKVV